MLSSHQPLTLHSEKPIYQFHHQLLPHNDTSIYQPHQGLQPDLRYILRLQKISGD